MNGSADGSVRRRTVVALVGGSLAAALVLAGCSGARSSSGAVDDTGGAPAYAVPSPSAKEPATGTAADAAGTVGQESGGRQAQPDLLTGRSVIRTAALTVRVDDVLASSARASTLAAAAGGFVAGEQTQAAPDHPGKAEAVLTLRVPAARLPQLMTQLRGLGTLLAETQNAEDVTGQVIDVKARISAQRASVARIQALLARATTVGQVVQIEGELTSRQAALESLEGQAAALADQTSLATVTATLVGPTTPAPVAASTPTGFGSGLARGWHAFTTAGTWLLTALGTVLPFLALLLPLAAVVALLRRRRPQAPTPAAPAPPPAATA